jgi:hypothetical protein
MKERKPPRSLDLDCAEYEVRGASIGHSRRGAVFRCTIGPLTEDLLNALTELAETKGSVRLVFPKQPLVLERVSVERIAPSSARISGHLTDP